MDVQVVIRMFEVETRISVSELFLYGTNIIFFGYLKYFWWDALSIKLIFQIS